MSYESVYEEISKEFDEWKDGDDSALYDGGYFDGISECVKILKNVKAQPELDKMPASFALSVVIATLEQMEVGGNG